MTLCFGFLAGNAILSLEVNVAFHVFPVKTIFYQINGRLTFRVREIMNWSSTRLRKHSGTSTRPAPVEISIQMKLSESGIFICTQLKFAGEF